MNPKDRLWGFEHIGAAERLGDVAVGDLRPFVNENRLRAHTVFTSQHPHI